LMGKPKSPIVAIIGPTAVGKTAISLAVAPAIEGEVISVDSRQVYRYMDIGTDKVSMEDRRHVIHHLVDVTDPDDTFTAARFVEEANGTIKRVIAREKRPLLVGGTPFYYNALFGEMLTTSLASDVEVRASLLKEAEIKGKGYLYKKLEIHDPDLALRIHPNDLTRIVRGLEVFYTTGKPASWWYRHGKKIKSPYNVLYIGIIRPREVAYNKIEQRARRQFERGLIDEVRWLLKNGFDERFPSMQGLGYREVVRYLRGLYSMDEALTYYIKATKSLYRRQMTWFKRFKPIVWYDLDEIDEDVAVSSIVDKIKEHMGVK